MSLRVAALLSSCLILGLRPIAAGHHDHALHAASRLPVAAGPASPATPERPRLIGRVLLPDDGSPLGIRVYVDAPAWRDSADVAATGEFAVALPPVRCDSLDVRIDAAGDGPRRYHMARIRVAVPRAGDPAPQEHLRVVLVPTTFTISGGTHAGVTVPIAVDGAVAAIGARARFWRVSRQASSRGVPIGWPEERFPLPLAVTGRSMPMRAADSASFWAIARDLERDFGRTLFRPISIDSARSEGWSVSVSVDPEEDTPGITFITYDGRGDVFDATIAIRSSLLLSDRRVVTHELLHALGFGHTAAWYSVMGGPQQSVAGATAGDVAHAQLFYRMRRLHLEQHATHGILASAAESGRLPFTVPWRACRAIGAAP